MLENWYIHDISQVEMGAQLPLKAYNPNSFGVVPPIITQFDVNLDILMLQVAKTFRKPCHMERDTEM